MASIGAVLRALAAAAAFSGLVGCYSNTARSAPDRALEIYREARSRRVPARTTSSGELSLTADRAVELALRNNPRIEAASARAAVAGAYVEEAGQFNNPEVRAQNIRLDRILRRRPQAEVALRVRPDRPGEIDAKVAQARAEESEARATALAEERAVEAEVRLQFANVLLLDAEVEAAATAAGVRRKIAAILREQMAGALATRVDVASADLAAEEAEQKKAALLADRAIALGALVDAIGLPGSARVRLVGDALDPAALPELPGEETLVEAAIRSRPEILAAAARIDAAEAGLYIERASRWPWISFLELGYAFAPDVPPGLGWSFSAGVEIPIFSTNRGAVLRAEAERTAARRELEAQVRLVASEVRARLREARAARDLVRAFNAGAVPAAERAAEEAQAALSATQVDKMRAALVEERRIAMMAQKLKLLRRYHEAAAELRAALGSRARPQ